MKRLAVVISAVFAFLLILGSQCVFYVQESQRALVLQLGEPLIPPRDPGLNFKLPFVQTVVFLDNRIQSFVIPKTYSLTYDLKTFEIDNYACWKIEDPVLFVRTLRNEDVAARRLRDIVYSQLREAIGNKELKEVVNTKRNEIMEVVLQKSRQRAEDYGVSIIDVRIKRTDLPNRDAIFKRMKAEREKMANKYRSEGESEKLRITSRAEMERDIILANANRQSIVIRGQADAEAMEIFAKAISVSPEFYEFTKSLEVYKNSFIRNSKVILSSDDDLLEFYNK